MTTVPISKADIADADIIDATELAASGLTSPSTYVTVNVTSTTFGTKTVVVALASDGEGILNSRDHPVEVGDYVVITGTSGGGLGNGTFTVASIVSDTSFTVNETIGTSTGGSATFEYPGGASKVGLDTSHFSQISHTTVQAALKDLDYDALLNDEPSGSNYTYANVLSSGKVTSETWTRNAGNKIKDIVYTYTNGKVTQEVRTVYDTNGTSVLAQQTIAYTYTGSTVSSETITRNV